MNKVIEHLDLSSVDGSQLNLDALYQIAPSVFTEACDPKTCKVGRKEITSKGSLGIALNVKNSRFMEKVEALYNKWKALQPLTEQKQYLFSQRFTVEYNYNSNHIEGNTLTYHAGCYKTRPNSVITRYGDRFEYATPEETPALMTDLVDWYNESEQSGKYSPVELAALFHYRYIRIHPFEDGNGRIARLMVNYIFSRHGWPMIVVRSRNKNEYIDALHQSDIEIGTSPSAGAHATLAQIKHFLKYFKQLVAVEIQYAIDFASETSPNVWWYDGQRVVFRSPSSSIILHTMQQYPDCTIEFIAQKAGIVEAAVKKQLAQMTKKGYIQRREKDGCWHVLTAASV